MRISATKQHADWSNVHLEQRKRLFETDRYATLDRAGITEESQTEIMEYRAAIRRIDKDFDHPEAVVWPDQPTPRKS